MAVCPIEGLEVLENHSWRTRTRAGIEKALWPGCGHRCVRVRKVLLNVRGVKLDKRWMFAFHLTRGLKLPELRFKFLSNLEDF